MVGWLNLPTGIYRFGGQRWYRRTKSGALCMPAPGAPDGDAGHDLRPHAREREVNLPP
jgi:hypothetical protein